MKVEIREWAIVDIYYPAGEEKSIAKIIKKYEKRGYQYQQTSAHTKNRVCAQMLSTTKIIKTE